MQRLIIFGWALDLAADVTALCCGASESAVNMMSLALGAVPVLAGLGHFVRRAMVNGDDAAEFRVETIRR
jgi:hypothetical protein